VTVRILPDHPNLDYLRREARQLLGALREADPTTSLSDAQREVATQYGFRTWPDLKAEVDRRRARPYPSDVGLGAAVAEAFGLGRLLAPPTAVSYTFMGRRWQLRTERGDWSASPVFDWIGHDQAVVGTELRERALAAGVAAPVPVRAPDGQLVKHIDGQNWRVDEWRELGPEVLQPVRGSLARQIGSTLAVLHEIGTPTDRTLLPGAHGHLSHRHSPEQWDDLVARTASAGRPWASELARLRSETLRPLESVPVPEIVAPFRVCINDLNVGAVRLGPAEEPVLVHWDFAGPNQPAWELGYVLMHWAVYGRTNPGTARALVSGYAERSGSVPQLDLSSFWIAITAHLNWTYDQFHRVLTREGEARSFSEGELGELLAGPLTPAAITEVLTEVATVG